MSVQEKLLKIQSAINVPKNQYNKFGNYTYRSCEDILSALKPFLTKTNCTVTINDDLVYIGDRYYIKSTATLIDCESMESISNVSYAREEETKKGMDSSQITGTASSYARKYALNGLLLLDDVKDADTNENQQQNQTPKKNNDQSAKTDDCKKQKKPIDGVRLEALRKRFQEHGIDEAKVCCIYKIKEISELSMSQYKNITEHFNQVKNECSI